MQKTRLFEIKNAVDFYQCLKSELLQVREDDGISDYELFKLLCSVVHLKDWMGHEPKTPAQQKLFDQLEDKNSAVGQAYNVLRELANAAKHWKIRTVTPATDIQILRLEGGDEMGGALATRQQIVETPLGETRVLGLIKDVFALYQAYFRS